MYKTILVPLDTTRTDEAILEHVRGLAAFAGAAVVLVHVADGFAARHQEALNLQDSREMDEDRAYLARCERELAGTGLRVRSVLEKGDPTTGILAAVAREKPDLIAMATHGHGLIADIVRGSVAEQLRHKTSVPILMVRAAKGS